MCKFSIIIPHKNLPKLLQTCLDSIPKRDDVEVIIVDDNSSSAIVNKEHFPGIGCDNVNIIFDKTGKGAGHARNLGIEQAKGEWVIFSDCDDYFITKNLNSLMNLDLKDYDVIAWPTEIRRIDGSVGLSTFRWSNVLDNFVPIDEKTTFVYDNNVKDILYRLYEPWTKMIRRSIIKDNNISFHETPLCNDLYFSMMLATKANNIGLCSSVIYRYIKRSNSLSDIKQKSREIIRVREFFRVQKLLLSVSKDNYLESIPQQIVNIGIKSFYSALKLCFIQMKEISISIGINTFFESICGYVEYHRRKFAIRTRIKKYFK